MKNRTIFSAGFTLWSVLLVILAIAAISGLGLVVWQKNTNLQIQNVACTAEAKQCPDGSYVGRTGPNCEFVACPNTTSPVVNANTTAPANTPVIEPKGTLLLSYRDIELSHIDNVSLKVAQGLCGIVFGNTCQWQGSDIVEKPFYINGSEATQPLIKVTAPASGITLTYGTATIIHINDPGPAGRHRVYLTHHNLLNEIDEVHEANIINVSANGQDLTWDLNEIFVNENGTNQIAQLQPGHYDLTVANVDTGVEGGIAGTIIVIDNSHGNAIPTSSLLKPYAYNTPLINSYWDGRGVFDDGGPGEDTIQLTGLRKDVVIYRGIDMPSQNQYQVLVFFRRTDNLVIVTANVEIIKFDDQTLRASDIIAQLNTQ